MELVIKIKGKDIKDIKMTQNGLGEYMYSKVLGYANVAMKDFEARKLKPPTGYRLYKDGSHQSTAGYKAQKAIDISSLGIAVANKDFKVTRLNRQGILSYVVGRFKSGSSWGKEVWFVHAANDYLKVGDIVKAGKAIAECVHNHFHLFMSGMDFWQFYMNQSPGYRIGDKIAFSEPMNLRDQKGKVMKAIAKGAVGALKSNGVFGTIAGYTGWWYDIDFLDAHGGQVAETHRNRKWMQTAPITNTNGSVPKPEVPCKDCKEAFGKLEQEVVELNKTVGTYREFENAVSDALETLKENLKG